MYKKIILPTDGSEYADREVARAKHLLAEDGEIIIVSVAAKLRRVQFESRKSIREESNRGGRRICCPYESQIR